MSSNIFDPNDYQELIGKVFVESKGEHMKLSGIVLAEDDWYWWMTPLKWPHSSKNQRLLSCVGDLEQWGFVPLKGFAK